MWLFWQGWRTAYEVLWLVEGGGSQKELLREVGGVLGQVGYLLVEPVPFGPLHSLGNILSS